MKLREQDKHFLTSLYFAIAVIFIWKGLWEGLYEIPYIGNEYVFLFIGFAMLTFSGMIFREFDPLGSVYKTGKKVLVQVKNHPHKDDFQIKYKDETRGKEVSINGKYLKGIEKKALIIVFPDKKEEVFVPFHRLIEVLYKGKKHWRL